MKLHNLTRNFENQNIIYWYKLKKKVTFIIKADETGVIYDRKNKGRNQRIVYATHGEKPYYRNICLTLKRVKQFTCSDINTENRELHINKFSVTHKHVNIEAIDNNGTTIVFDFRTSRYKFYYIE